MEQLELRTYSREEISEITGISTASGHFARDVKNRLSRWGYEYSYNPKRVKIEKKPETAKEKLYEYMQRELGLSVQIEAEPFAWFLWLLILLIISKF